MIDIYIWHSLFLQRDVMSWDGCGRVDLGFKHNFDAVTNADHWVLKTGILQLLEGTCVMDIL